MNAGRTHIMSSNADRPEVTAATRKNSRARKKPVMSAMSARQEPTWTSAMDHMPMKLLMFWY